MDRRLELVLILAMVGFSGTTAGASAITYEAEGATVGLSAFTGQTVTLPDLTAGGSVTIGTIFFDNSASIAGLAALEAKGGPVALMGGYELGDYFDFHIQGYGATGNPVGSSIGVQGQYQGAMQPNDPPGRQSASFTGFGTSVDLGVGGPVPEALQNLASNPGRMRISTLISFDAAGNTLESVVLTIAPASVPEPSTMVTMLSAAGLAFVARKWARRS